MNRLKNSIIAKILIYQLIAYLTFACPTNALAQKKRTKRVQEYITVLDLRTKEDILKKISVPLTEKLLTEIQNTRKYKVVDRAHRDNILKEQGFQLKDECDSECIVKVGQLVGVGKIVTGSISKIGEAYYINTQLINVETGVVEASADKKCSKCKLDELIDSVGVTGKKLMGLVKKIAPLKCDTVDEIFEKPLAKREYKDYECLCKAAKSKECLKELKELKAKGIAIGMIDTALDKYLRTLPEEITGDDLLP